MHGDTHPGNWYHFVRDLIQKRIKSTSRAKKIVVYLYYNFEQYCNITTVLRQRQHYYLLIVTQKFIISILYGLTFKFLTLYQSLYV